MCICVYIYIYIYIYTKILKTLKLNTIFYSILNHVKYLICTISIHSFFQRKCYFSFILLCKIHEIDQNQQFQINAAIFDFLFIKEKLFMVSTQKYESAQMFSILIIIIINVS